jgi:hypothetical protein
MSCSGSSTNQSDPTCIDFAKYQNLPALVPDYLGCVVDRTTGVDFEALVSANPSDNEIETRIVQPGVCITGVCRSDICRSVRCNNRGNCGLSSGALKSIKKGLGIGGSDGFDSAQQEAALIRCNCDRGFFGTMCQFVGNSSAINSKRTDK